MKIAIDLLWVRCGEVGGTESFIRNLLDGFLKIDDVFDIVLLVSNDNEESFRKYTKDDRFSLLQCNIESKNVWKRIIWQNIFLGKKLKENGINRCYEPVYAKPILNYYNVTYLTTIHDLQALHYPQYQSFFKLLWLKLCWWNAVRYSKKIIAISDFVYKDIIANYNVEKNNILRIYNPIVIQKDKLFDISFMKNKYQIDSDSYLYTVSSLLPHKNLITLIKVVKYIIDNKIDLPSTLVISGINKGKFDEIIDTARQYNVVDKVILTGFISNQERNTLYNYAEFFLFPSLFEGFGMPPVEANYFNCKTVTTRATCIPEITENKLVYVENPIDEKEWVEKILLAKSLKINKIDYSKYNNKKIANGYMDIFKENTQ